MSGYRYKSPPVDETKKDKYWAVGFKEWVEIRSHPTEPKAYQSEATIKVNRRESYWGADGNVKRRNVKHPHKITQVIHRGGEVIGHVGHYRFYAITHLFIAYGQCLPISAQQVKELGLRVGQ